MHKTTTPQGQAAEQAVVMLSYGGRTNDDITPETLADLRELASQIEQAMWHQAEVLRNGDVSQSAIASAMGVSRQAVHKRFARLDAIYGR